VTSEKIKTTWHNPHKTWQVEKYSIRSGRFFNAETFLKMTENLVDCEVSPLAGTGLKRASSGRRACSWIT
jgi:hypothetical protein